jgi:hypothetical protein
MPDSHVTKSVPVGDSENAHLVPVFEVYRKLPHRQTITATEVRTRRPQHRVPLLTHPFTDTYLSKPWISLYYTIIAATHPAPYFNTSFITDQRRFLKDAQVAVLTDTSILRADLPNQELRDRCNCRTLPMDMVL